RSSTHQLHCFQRPEVQLSNCDVTGRSFLRVFKECVTVGKAGARTCAQPATGARFQSRPRCCGARRGGHELPGLRWTMLFEEVAETTLPQRKQRSTAETAW
ncbi:Protein of unknown function, partial [Gryllus bimaculatus]